MIYILNEIIPKETVREILKIKNFSYSFSGTVLCNGELIENSYRKVKEYDIPENMENFLYENIKNTYNIHLKQIYKKDLLSIEKLQFLHYEIGGQYDFHNDSEDIIDGKWTKVVDRDLTFIIYLNDYTEYEGGRLVFSNHNEKILPKAGTIVTFPSDHHYEHKVTPLTEGNRYCIVTWLRLK